MVLLFQTFVSQSPLLSLPSGLVVSWSYTQYLFINIYLEMFKLSVRMSGFCWGHLGHLLWMPDGSLSWGNADCALWSWWWHIVMLCAHGPHPNSAYKLGDEDTLLTVWPVGITRGGLATTPVIYLTRLEGMGVSCWMQCSKGHFRPQIRFQSQIWGFQMDMWEETRTWNRARKASKQANKQVITHSILELRPQCRGSAIRILECFSLWHHTDG